MRGDRLSGIDRLLRIRDINHDCDSRVPAKLHEVEQRLRDNRPALTALELDAIKVRTMASASQGSTSLFAKKRRTFMKSRVAVLLVLALGVFMSGTGATLAVSGLASSGSASSAQYPEPNQHSNALGANESGGNGPSGTSNAVQTTPAETQAVRQVASTSSGSLPFTGFLAIPVLIVGVGLVGAGVAMRLRLRSGNDAA
jgi:hypothetical protein